MRSSNRFRLASALGLPQFLGDQVTLVVLDTGLRDVGDGQHRYGSSRSNFSLMVLSEQIHNVLFQVS